MPYIRNGTVTQKPLYVTVLELIMSFFETLKLLYLVFFAVSTSPFFCFAGF